MKIEEGSEVYAILVGPTGGMVDVSEKVALTAYDGAFSAFAEASFAVALALIAMTGF